MLYLAEVHKKTGFMGNKTELKLLARQQSEQNWAMLPGEETIPAEIANEYNSGVLVLVELDANQQVKKIQDATRHLVGILKNFSRMREKFRTQEEEIEGWKQSLIYQSQELTRREVDIEARAEELQQLESESHKIEEQRQEFEATRSQILELKGDIERDRAQLEEAWGLLRNAQQQLSQEQQSTTLSDEQVQALEELMGRLEVSLLSGETLNQPLQALQGVSGAHQEILQQFWDRMDQGRQELERAQPDLDQQTHALEQAWKKWHEDRDMLHHLQIQARIGQETLDIKQAHHRLLSQQLQVQTDLEKSLQYLKDGVSGDSNVDVDALRNQPLEALEATVEKLRQELGKLSRFVSDQEEELALQNQTVEDLKAKMALASEYDRMNIAVDLEEEQQNYQFLEETLQGQRQTLRDRNSILRLHQNILNQRKGVISKDDSGLGPQVEPLLAKVSAQRASLQSAIQALEEELTVLQNAVQQSQTQAAESSEILVQTRSDLENQSKVLNQRRTELGQLNGCVDTLQQTLQPIQDHLHRWNESLSNLSSPLVETASQQQQVVQELKQRILTLGQANKTN
ncbi:pilus motility taxis protein HmpF [Altericista sp. CCNU0014]|uniref:pilus motility taxis protein HmpF n=1 Tax=Altericista sp. CCNU0014 TaxID=3082949 RepID=UPI00384D74DD